MAEERTDRDEASAKDRERRLADVQWGRLATLLVLAGATGFLIYQNLEQVPLRVFWWEFSIPLVVVVVATALLTLVVEVLVKTVVGWRRRKTSRRYPPRR